MRFGLAILTGLFCLSGFAETASAGDIRGHIEITKSLTQWRLIPQLRDGAWCLKPEGNSSIDELDRLAIYLEGPGLDSGTPVNAKLVQQRGRFDPEILVVPVNSTVAFPNADPIFHNVFSLSKAKQFDLGYYRGGQPRTVRFDKAGVVQVYCHLHPHMNAAIVVVPSAWYTRPSHDGSFMLSGIPQGTYVCVVWHKSAGFLKRRVELQETGTTSVDLTIPNRDMGRSQ